MAQTAMYAAKVNSPAIALTAAISDADVVIPVSDATKLPAPPNLATIGTDETAETILYTGVSNNTLTGVTRGFQGTARPWASGTSVARMFTAYDHDTFIANINDLAVNKLDIIGGTISGNLTINGTGTALNVPNGSVSIGGKFSYDNTLGAFGFGTSAASGARLSAAIDAANSSAARFLQTAANATVPVVIVQGGATPGSGGDLFQIQDNNGNVLARFTSSGWLGIGTNPSQAIDISYGNFAMTQYQAPASALTAALGSSGSVTDVSGVCYVYTFVTPYGETAPSPVSAAVSPNAQKVNLSNIGVDPNGNAIARKIYRTKNGGKPPFYLLTTINDNTTTTYTDNTADASLGAQIINDFGTTGGFIFVNGARSFAAGNTGSLAIGIDALNGTAVANGGLTAVGYQTLYSNTSGINNTAVGYQVLYRNTLGSSNIAVGYQTLYNVTSGSNNTAMGHQALMSNNVSSATAFGYQALFGSSSAGEAFGYRALYSNTNGSTNAAFGNSALYSNTTGNNNTALGPFALNKSVNGSDNVAVGVNALYNSTASGIAGNTAVGSSALYSNTSGTNNTALGYKALYSNAAGNNNNTALGSQALYSNTASNNTAVGYQALYNNTTGSPNDAFGYQALYTNTTGTNNVAIGRTALYTNNGSNNTAAGFAALYSNSSGTDNTAFGYEALNFNTTSSGNSAFGSLALFANTGSGNTAVGYYALKNNTNASNNTAVGYQALLGNTTGSPNDAFGYQALKTNTTGFGNVAFGYQSLFNNSGNYNTAFGTQALYTQGAASNNVAVGYQALYKNTSGTGNTAIGYLAGYTGTSGAWGVTSGSNNTFVGYNAGFGSATQLTNATAIGANATVTQSNSLILGDSNTTVGIGTTAPDLSTKFHVVGDARITGKLILGGVDPIEEGLVIETMIAVAGAEPAQVQTSMGPATEYADGATQSVVFNRRWPFGAGVNLRLEIIAAMDTAYAGNVQIQVGYQINGGAITNVPVTVTTLANTTNLVTVDLGQIIAAAALTQGCMVTLTLSRLGADVNDTHTGKLRVYHIRIKRG